MRAGLRLIALSMLGGYRGSSESSFVDHWKEIGDVGVRPRWKGGLISTQSRRDGETQRALDSTSLCLLAFDPWVVGEFRISLTKERIQFLASSSHLLSS
jgi:hypothetical protein